MTKAKAKTLISALIDDGFSPTISVINGNYTIRVSSENGVTTAQVQNAETSLAIAAKIYQVEFN